MSDDFTRLKGEWEKVCKRTVNFLAKNRNLELQDEVLQLPTLSLAFVHAPVLDSPLAVSVLMAEIGEALAEAIQKYSKAADEESGTLN